MLALSFGEMLLSGYGLDEASQFREANVMLQYEQRGVWKDRPRHDEASHAADGFMTFACSNFPEKEHLAAGRERDRYRDRPDRNRGISWMAA